ncbi:hypothetical protein ADK67_42790 [Saccharothrix sp. NRRL B-16348]|uniref:hypothetical protein n=1 Tax=Saccharothrix sp. NRRL B-16348 TaxID=1415542 RepID=UPI0006AEC609|nr:hypothetical protein [Saccharothrix sp. NRRL B-16348]KOX14499.1 hypothetical protein ADK67_42790 [Saccharothrix sp. NRRL B-16348]
MSAWARPLALLAEVLLIGVLVTAAALPVLTALPAAAAGAVLLRELVDDGRTPTARRFVVLLGQAVRDPFAVVLPLVVLAVGALDVLALLGGLPGASVLGPVIGLALAAVVLVLLRAAARWNPGDRWAVLLTAPSRDWVGYAYLVVALAVAGLVVVQAPAFAVVVPGLLVFAAVAVERR